VTDSLTLLAVATLACAAGAGLAWWMARLRTRAAVSEARVAAERDLAAATERASGLERRAADLEARLCSADETREQVRSELAAAQAHVAQLEATLAHEREAGAEKLAVLNDAQRQLTEAFKALSSDALKSNNTAFLELARETFGRLQQQSTGDLEKRQQAIDGLVKPLKESLEKVDAKISEIEAARARAYGQLGQQLEQLGSAQLRLQTEASRLSTALRSTTYAGSWGELQLRRVVEMADMLPYVDFAEQETAGALRADMVVRLPAGQRIVVDAKAPLQSYREALDATDEPTRAARMAEHAQKVRTHIDALGAKSYWEQFQPAPEFVVLFMPGDHFLSAALQADSSLLERAITRRVLLATPTTLIALLKAASFGWRQEAVSQNAEEIARIGRDLHARMATFAEHLERAGNGIAAAVKSYNAAVGSFEQSLLPGARRFAELGAKGAKQLPEPAPIDTTPRDVTRRS
jgi:DNA recombination protein RmuC